MSNWIENTIVTKKWLRDEFLSEYKSFDEVSNLNEMTVGNLVIFIFDSNGDNPWYTGDGKCECLINEMVYGPGNGRVTEFVGKDGNVRESRLYASTLLSKLIPDPQEYEEAKNFIKYTIS